MSATKALLRSIEARLGNVQASLDECDHAITTAEREAAGARSREAAARQHMNNLERAVAVRRQETTNMVYEAIEVELVDASRARRIAEERLRRLVAHRHVLAGQRDQIADETAALVTTSLPPRAEPPRAIGDAEGFHLRPDPIGAATSAELVTLLRRYRIWAGEPSFREMARRARPHVAFSTMCTALNSDELPPLRVVLAIVSGCGGDDEDRQRFATAWRILRLASEDGAAPEPLQHIMLRAVP